jgi:dUTP pyrophosphatase
MLNVPIAQLDPDLALPSYAHAGDAGLDLRAREDVVLAPAGGRALVPTGIAIAAAGAIAAIGLARRRRRC